MIVLHCAAIIPSLLQFCTHLRDEETFDLLVDLTAVDHGLDAEIRFTVVFHLVFLDPQNLSTHSCKLS